MKFIYLFGSNITEGNANQSHILGGKGANLAEMSNLNIIMYLILNGASLNNLNLLGKTPLAYDKKGLIKRLSLMEGITTKKRTFRMKWFQ